MVLDSALNGMLLRHWPGRQNCKNIVRK